MLLTIALTGLTGGIASRPDCFAEEPTIPGASVKLTDGTWSDIQKLISEQKGKVVIVDLWSTGCPPCMREFPNLVKLQQQHPKRVVCVSFNIDYAGIKSKPPEYYRPRVEKFLASRKATIRNFMSTTESDEIYIDLKLNSIPAVFVYGKDGKLAKQFDDRMLKPGSEDAFTYEHDIVPYVEAMLK